MNGKRTISAKALKPGHWIVYHNERLNQRVVDVDTTADGFVKAHLDYGNGGEPATSFFEPEEKIYAL